MLERSYGFKSHSESVRSLLRGARENLPLPGNAKSVYYSDALANVTGPSGCGKTTFIKTIAAAAPGPALFVDPADEYMNIKKVTLAELISFKWRKADRSVRIRFVPNQNPHLSRTELDLLFTQLNVQKQEGFQSQRQPSGSLHTWCFFFDEAHRLKSVESAMNFINEARKFTRKVVIICSDPALFGPVSRLVSPPTLESMIPKLKNTVAEAAESFEGAMR